MDNNYFYKDNNTLDNNNGIEVGKYHGFLYKKPTLKCEFKHFLEFKEESCSCCARVVIKCAT